jgi:hypothetical protein
MLRDVVAIAVMALLFGDIARMLLAGPARPEGVRADESTYEL